MPMVISAILLCGCVVAADEKKVAESAGKTDLKDKIETAEKCEISPPEKPFACTMQYDPVCGCDGKTYGNACSARGAGVPHSTPGACENKSENS